MQCIGPSGDTRANWHATGSQSNNAMATGQAGCRPRFNAQRNILVLLASPVLSILAWLRGSCVARDNCLEARWRHCSAHWSHSSTHTGQHRHTHLSPPADWRSATRCALQGNLPAAVSACMRVQRPSMNGLQVFLCARALTALVEAGGPKLLGEGSVGAYLHGGPLHSCWLCRVKHGSWHTSSTATAETKNKKRPHSTPGSVALATGPVASMQAA